MKWKNILAVGGVTILGLLVGVSALASVRSEIDSRVIQTLDQFYAQNPANKQLAEKAAGMLVFPSMTKVGVGVGAEHGNGALQVKGKNVDYYTMAGGSIGATLGVSNRSEIIMFTTKEALDKFTSSKGWKIGVDAGVTLVTVGAGGDYDTNTLQKPVIGFIVSEKGLMADVSLEGAKITKMKAD